MLVAIAPVLALCQHSIANDFIVSEVKSIMNVNAAHIRPTSNVFSLTET